MKLPPSRTFPRKDVGGEITTALTTLGPAVRRNGETFPRGRLVAPVAIATGVAVAWLMAANDTRNPGPADVSLVLAVGWSFVASGIIAWRLRPANLIGRVMIATGFLRFAAALGWSQDPLLFSIGRSLQAAYLVSIAYVLLAFPHGRLDSLVERALFWLAVVAGGPLHAAWLMFGARPDDAGCAGCPDYLFEVVKAEPAARTFMVAHEALGAIVGLFALGVLIHRWRHASAPLRYAIAPILWAGAAALVAAMFWMINNMAGDPNSRTPALLMNLMLALVAVAFLAGVGRTRLARFAVADLVVGLGDSPAPGELQTALAHALHDPSLRVAYWMADEERFVDSRGKSVDVTALEEQVTTMINRDGRRIAALIHDPAALDDEQLVDSVVAAAGLQLDNERLQAELRAQLEEVEASRARILAAAQDERRRIERDLHDGTQQRLVSVAMTLGLADSKLSTDPDGATKLVKDAKSQLSETLQELRDLSQGIHPGILTERGLPTALSELTERLGIPLVLDVSLTERLPDRVEEATYYVVSEALTNVLKHANAANIGVQVGHLDGYAFLRVSDDGVGGADSTRGSGIRGLRDRVEALGGHLKVTSPHAGGTVLEAEIPCG